MLHHEERLVGFWVFPGIKNRNDSRMRKLSGRSGFLRKALSVFLFFGFFDPSQRNGFYSDNAIDIWILSAVHHSHRAASNLGFDMVPPKRFADGNCHRYVNGKVHPIEESVRNRPLDGYCGNRNIRVAGVTAAYVYVIGLSLPWEAARRGTPPTHCSGEFEVRTALAGATDQSSGSWY